MAVLTSSASLLCFGERNVIGMSEQRCPKCRNRQKASNKNCFYCGENLENVGELFKTNQPPIQESIETKKDLYGQDFYEQIKKDARRRKEKKGNDWFEFLHVYIIIALCSIANAIGITLILAGWYINLWISQWNSLLTIGISLSCISTPVVALAVLYLRYKQRKVKIAKEYPISYS